ncbi:MAG: radical SAM protein [Dehalococcoidia bacterium]
MDVRVLETASSALLSPQTAGSFVREFDYTINPYGGCAFACAYCYVPSVLRGRAEKMGGWGTYVEARVRAPAVLARQRHLLAGRSFFCASATDPWQPAERRYEITRRLLEILAGVPFTFGLFSTRSPLVLRDLDLLGAMAQRTEVGISLPTDREDVRRVFEPRNPPVAARLETARRLREAGIAVRLHVSPAQPATAEFPRLAGEVADWVWLDWPAHLRADWTDLYRQHGLGEWLRRERIEEEAARWRSVLGDERVKIGREWFAWRAGHPERSEGSWGESDREILRSAQDDNGRPPGG